MAVDYRDIGDGSEVGDVGSGDSGRISRGGVVVVRVVEGGCGVVVGCGCDGDEWGNRVRVAVSGGGVGICKGICQYV